MRLAWGAVALGAMAGLGLASVLFLVLAAMGSGTSGGNVAVVLVQLFALLAAGYVAGRLSPAVPAYHGGLAGLAVAGVSATISLAGGAAVGLVPLFVLALTGMALGSAGGVLSQLGQRG